MCGSYTETIDTIETTETAPAPAPVAAKDQARVEEILHEIALNNGSSKTWATKYAQIFFNDYQGADALPGYTVETMAAKMEELYEVYQAEGLCHQGINWSTYTAENL